MSSSLLLHRRRRVAMSLSAVLLVPWAAPAVRVAADELPAGSGSPGVPRTWVSAESARTPSVSADGRFVAYVVDPPDDRATTVVVRDRQLGTSTDVLPRAGVVGESVFPMLSGDGCTLTVVTEIPLDRFRDDDNGLRWDVYQRRLGHCDGQDSWQVVSSRGGIGSAGAAVGSVDPTVPPAVSYDGSVVAFARRISVAERASLPDDLPIDATTVEIQNIRTRRTVTVTDDDAVAVATSPTISDDGTDVAFTVVNDAEPHVVVWSLDVRDPAATAERLAGSSSQPALSGDGSKIAFVSTTTGIDPAAQLPACRATCIAQVYVADRSTRRSVLASLVGGNVGFVAGNGPSSHPVLDRTGSQVVYVTRATNLFAGRSRIVGGPGTGEIVRHLLGSDSVERVSVAADGFGPTPAVHSWPRISSGGRAVVFDSKLGAGRGGSLGRSVSMVVVDPVLTLTDLDVGEVAIGFSSIGRSLTLTNHGPAMFVPASVAVDGVDFSVSGGTCAVGVAVAPGGSCTVEIAFFPGAAGERGATLTVAEEGFGAASAQAALVGVGGDPRIGVEPILFDATRTVVGTVGASGTFLLQVVNARRTTVTSVELGGESPGDFAITADECTGTLLTNGEVCSVTVDFRPTAGGNRRAVLVMSSQNGGRAVVSLVGEGVHAPSLRLGRGAVGASAGVPRVMSPSRIVVEGSGFAASTAAIVAWADGSGRPVILTTDERGSFSTQLIVFPGQRLGDRSIVASALGHSASVVVRVVAAPR